MLAWTWSHNPSGFCLFYIKKELILNTDIYPTRSERTANQSYGINGIVQGMKNHNPSLFLDDQVKHPGLARLFIRSVLCFILPSQKLKSFILQILN